jgi:perosamine synthetase
MISIAKPLISQDEKDAVSKIMDSGMLAAGQAVADFENAFAGYIGVQHGIAASSGTTALEVALRAMEIGPGDKIITTAYSFIATANCIIYVGAAPVFVDIDPETFNISLISLEKCLKQHPDARAVLVAHLFGQACDMDGIMALANKYHVQVIEDCAQAHGAKWNGKKAGSFGSAAIFSFYPTKNMTTGEGGIILTDDETIAAKSRLLINHGMKIRYTHEILGYNYRMTNIAAAIGLEQLKKLDHFNDLRRRNAAYYDRNIHHPMVEIPYVQHGAWHVYHQYTIKVHDGRRNEMIKHFEKNGIGYGVFYPFSIPEQPVYKNMEFETDWPVTDRIKTQVLSIPVHPVLTEEELKKVVEVIHSL